MPTSKIKRFQLHSQSVNKNKLIGLQRAIHKNHLREREDEKRRKREEEERIEEEKQKKLHEELLKKSEEEETETEADVEPEKKLEILETKLEGLQDQKHSLFIVLKRILHEDEKRKHEELERIRKEKQAQEQKEREEQASKTPSPAPEMMSPTSAHPMAGQNMHDTYKSFPMNRPAAPQMGRSFSPYQSPPSYIPYEPFVPHHDLPFADHPPTSQYQSSDYNSSSQNWDNQTSSSNNWNDNHYYSHNSSSNQYRYGGYQMGRNRW